MGPMGSGQGNFPQQGQVVPPTAEQSAAIGARISKLNNLALLLGVFGLGLQVVGGATDSLLLKLAGTAVLVVGLGLYARMRGREAWWGLLGLLSCLGLIVLYLLPKTCHHCGATTKGKVCSTCGAPAPL